MAIANLSWSLDASALDALITAGFDLWKVQREDAGPTWNEISFSTTRPPIVADVLSNVYSDPNAPVDANGNPNANYRAVPLRSSDLAENSPISVSAVRRGYITPQDIWDEGYANPPWTPAKVWRGIDRVTATIDQLCGQWFEPRYSQFAYDGIGHDQQWLDQPICALFQLIQDDTIVDLSDLEVYNRHLTRGQTSPDDRQNPKVTYSLDFPVGYRGRRQRLVADAALFGQRRKNVVMKGVFGYTELGPGNIAAETAEGSQIPVSYGQTPAEIKRAALLLALTYMLPAANQQEASLESRITQIKTRDQSISFSDPSSTDGSFGLTGNVEVDNILSRYTGPIRMGVIGQ